MHHRFLLAAGTLSAEGGEEGAAQSIDGHNIVDRRHAVSNPIGEIPLARIEMIPRLGRREASAIAYRWIASISH